MVKWVAMALVVSFLGNTGPVRAETMRGAEFDPLTDQEVGWLATEAISSSSGKAYLKLVCDRQEVAVNIYNGTIFHPDILMKVSYRADRLEPKLDDVWMWDRHNFVAMRGLGYTVSIIQQLIAAQSFYVRFEEGQDAYFSLHGEQQKFAEFRAHCMTLNSRFAKEFPAGR